MEPGGPAAASSPTGSTATAASSSLIFLGTGCSGALPDTRCLIKPSGPPCAVCSTALSLPPDQNPNYRCVQIQISKPEDGDEVAQAAQLEWKIIEGDVDKPFIASGLEFVPLPLIESLPAAISKSGAGQLDLLILEANNLDLVLLSLQSLDAIKRICPKRALLIGMRHMFEHHKVNDETLAKWSCK
ncbi:hypothetical protein PR202_gb15736 [Eleusine coracana subsp. coracana]|uniref:Uncharacterized protein n=1 Tax=Eleusine coracana subsp. coracana TaxID=191504 RepID=A0AAV5EYN5_ELECO|nr:hypothetical protein PR202_gb15736 [Eleusine coracana subsp. coracana]